MTEFQGRPSIFLYTDEAELSDEIRLEMIKAGYLPVRVKSMAHAKLIAPPMTVDPTDMAAVTHAALSALVQSGASTSTHLGVFGSALAKMLLAAKNSG